MNIGLLSPSQNAFSETFIQAHKHFLKGNVFFYYGNKQNKVLEGKGSLAKSKRSIFYKLQRICFKKTYSWYHERLLIESFKKNKIDVVLAEYGPTAQDYLSVIREVNLPLIVHFHGFDASRRTTIKCNKEYTDVFLAANFIIAVSKKMKKDLIDLGCPPEKLIYNVYGPDERFFDVKAKFEKAQFIFVGRFVNKKAPYYLILSFFETLKKFPNAKLVLAGEGELHNTCLNLVRYLKIEDSVGFPGVITPDQYKDYLKESLVYIQHSVTAEDGDSEGTPVAILEAAAAGLPILSTNHAGISDAVLQNETGLLVEEHDVKGMAANMLRILEDVHFAQKLGLNGRKHIFQNFNLKKHIETLDDLLRKAVESKK